MWPDLVAPPISQSIQEQSCHSLPHQTHSPSLALTPPLKYTHTSVLTDAGGTPHTTVSIRGLIVEVWATVIPSGVRQADRTGSGEGVSLCGGGMGTMTTGEQTGALLADLCRG